MTRRERVCQALRHREADRLPLDLGGMDSTGITGMAYNRLKAYLGLEGGETRIYDPYQQAAEVEPEVLELIGADVRPIFAGPREWQAGRLPDGSPCLLPRLWNPVTLADGSEVVRDRQDVIRAHRPASGFYFEPVNPPLADVSSVAELEAHLGLLAGFDAPAYWDESYEEMGQRARRLFEETDYALMGNFAVHLFAAGQLLRGYEQFLMDLMVGKPLAHCLLEHLTQTFLERFDRFHQAVGDCVQIINVNDDLGMETSLLLSPATYREMIKPYHARLYQHIKKTSGAYLFLHTDGSVYEVIPDLIEVGVDILNPVQFTCKHMELSRLKREFGRDLVFWGGGADTQRVLPFGRPEQVQAHVRECLSVLAPGGGFVFNQVHNLQPDVPPENIMAMYAAVHEWQY